NEFQLEFYRRVTAALMFFRVPGTRWWDARGDVYVRFGAPDAVDTVEGEIAEPAFETMHVILPDQILWKYRQYDVDFRLAETTFSGFYTFPYPTPVMMDSHLLYHVTPMERVLDREHGEIGWDPEADFINRKETVREQRAQGILNSGSFAVRIDLRKRIIP